MKNKIFKLIILLNIVLIISGYSNANALQKNEKYLTNTSDKSIGCNNYNPNESCSESSDSCENSEYSTESDESSENNESYCEPCEENEPCKSSKSCNSCQPYEPKGICAPCKSCTPCEPCCTEVPKTNPPCLCAYNAPARIDPACGIKAWVTGSFIYWEPKEKGIELGRHNEIADLIIYKKLHIDFDYHPGFKIGTGFSIYRDDWTLYLEYTRLKSSDSKTDDIGASFIDNTEQKNILESAWLFNSAQYSFLKAKWKLNYNMFDLELGRPYYLGKKVIFKPNFGLRGGLIDQKISNKGIFINIETLIATEYIRNNKSNSWIIGPRIGLDSDWLIGCNFKLFFNVAGSLTFQDFKTSYLETTVIPSNQMFSGKDKMKLITPNADFDLGLGYGKYFSNNAWYLDLTIGYDFHYFWDQNFMRNLNNFDSFNIDDTDIGNLTLQGLTITARIDF